MEEIITISCAYDDLDMELNNILSIVKPGDLLYWDLESDGKYNHATIITGLDEYNHLAYSGHTNPRDNVAIRNSYKTGNTITIIRLKDIIVQ